MIPLRRPSPFAGRGNGPHPGHAAGPNVRRVQRNRSAAKGGYNPRRTIGTDLRWLLPLKCRNDAAHFQAAAGCRPRGLAPETRTQESPGTDAPVWLQPQHAASGQGPSSQDGPTPRQRRQARLRGPEHHDPSGKHDHRLATGWSKLLGGSTALRQPGPVSVHPGIPRFEQNSAPNRKIFGKKTPGESPGVALPASSNLKGESVTPGNVV